MVQTEQEHLCSDFEGYGTVDTPNKRGAWTRTTRLRLALLGVSMLAVVALVVISGQAASSVEPTQLLETVGSDEKFIDNLVSKIEDGASSEASHKALKTKTKAASSLDSIADADLANLDHTKHPNNPKMLSSTQKHEQALKAQRAKQQAAALKAKAEAVEKVHDKQMDTLAQKFFKAYQKKKEEADDRVLAEDGDSDSAASIHSDSDDKALEAKKKAAMLKAKEEKLKDKKMDELAERDFKKFAQSKGKKSLLKAPVHHEVLAQEAPKAPAETAQQKKDAAKAKEETEKQEKKHKEEMATAKTKEEEQKKLQEAEAKKDKEQQEELDKKEKAREKADEAKQKEIAEKNAEQDKAQAAKTKKLIAEDAKKEKALIEKYKKRAEEDAEKAAKKASESASKSTKIASAPLTPAQKKEAAKQKEEMTAQQNAHAAEVAKEKKQQAAEKQREELEQKKDKAEEAALAKKEKLQQEADAAKEKKIAEKMAQEDIAQEEKVKKIEAADAKKEKMFLAKEKAEEKAQDLKAKKGAEKVKGKTTTPHTSLEQASQKISKKSLAKKELLEKAKEEQAKLLATERELSKLTGKKPQKTTLKANTAKANKSTNKAKPSTLKARPSKNELAEKMFKALEKKDPKLHQKLHPLDYFKEANAKEEKQLKERSDSMFGAQKKAAQKTKLARAAQKKAMKLHDKQMDELAEKEFKQYSKTHKLAPVPGEKKVLLKNAHAPALDDAQKDENTLESYMKKIKMTRMAVHHDAAYNTVKSLLKTSDLDPTTKAQLARLADDDVQADRAGVQKQLAPKVALKTEGDEPYLAHSFASKSSNKELEQIMPQNPKHGQLEAVAQKMLKELNELKTNHEQLKAAPTHM